MVLPSKSKQIKLIADLLDEIDGEEGFVYEDAAERIVESYLGALKPKEIPPPPHHGMAFVTPFDNHVHFIAWADEKRAWVVHEKSHYGSFIKLDHEFWKYIEASPDRRRLNRDQPRPGSPGTNPDWKVGDVVSLSQRMAQYDIVATGLDCVLMKNQVTGDVQADSNANLEKYYTREMNEGEDLF